MIHLRRRHPLCVLSWTLDNDGFIRTMLSRRPWDLTVAIAYPNKGIFTRHGLKGRRRPQSLVRIGGETRCDSL